jgi:6-pyruvoyltetrahydropterin/6-carboxytetrahydropterin synthase
VGTPDPETGMVVNLRELDRIVREAVVNHVDHKHLNRDVEFLRDVMPTAENLAVAFWQQLEDRLGSLQLDRLRLIESENNSVELSRR